MGSFDAGYGADLWPGSSATKRRGRFGTSAASTPRKRPSRWGWSTRWCPWSASKKRRSLGPRRSSKEPDGIRFLKAAFNADTDGLAGLQQLAGDATLLYYLTDEAKEGRDAFLEKRKPDFSKFPRSRKDEGFDQAAWPDHAVSLRNGAAQKKSWQAQDDVSTVR